MVPFHQIHSIIDKAMLRVSDKVYLSKVNDVWFVSEQEQVHISFILCIYPRTQASSTLTFRNVRVSDNINLSTKHHRSMMFGMLVHRDKCTSTIG